MVRLIGVALVAGALSACATPEPGTPGPQLTKPISFDGKSMQWDQRGDPRTVFRPSDDFDIELAGYFTDQARQVHVRFAGQTRVNELPPRIGQWLAEVKKSNGQVQALDPSEPAGGDTARGMDDIITAVFSILGHWEDDRERSRRLATAHAYDARILYDSATGNAKEIVFVRRTGSIT